MDISRAKEILDYWFSKGLYTPDYDKWFMKSQDYDVEIKEKFGDLLKEAEKGKGFGWLHNKDSFIAYIILMDQFSRHIYRGTGDAFKNDNGVMIFTELGFDIYKNELKGYEFMFAFMPYMHTENATLQQKGGNIFTLHKGLYMERKEVGRRRLTSPIHVSYMYSLDEKTNYDKEFEMLTSMEPHVKGHKEVISIYRRFPKRNKALGRENTKNEETYLQRPEVQKRPY